MVLHRFIFLSILFLSFGYIRPVFVVLKQFKLPNGKIVSLLGNDHTSRGNQEKEQCKALYNILKNKKGIHSFIEVPLRQKAGFNIVYKSPLLTLCNKLKQGASNVESRFAAVIALHILKQKAYPCITFLSKQKERHVLDLKGQGLFDEFSDLQEQIILSYKNNFTENIHLKNLIDKQIRIATYYKNLLLFELDVEHDLLHNSLYKQVDHNHVTVEKKALIHKLVILAFAPLFDLMALIKMLKKDSKHSVLMTGCNHVLNIESMLTQLNAQIVNHHGKMDLSKHSCAQALKIDQMNSFVEMPQPTFCCGCIIL